MPNPFQLIEFNAKAYPAKLALYDGKYLANYQQLRNLAKKMAAKLAKAGVRKGELVVTCLPPGLDWLMTLALFHEACVTCSNHGYMPINATLEVAWIVSDRSFPHFPAEKLILIDKSWFDELNQASADREMQQYADQDSLCRLVLTSGTTGHSRAVPYSVGLLDRRMQVVPSYWSVSRPELNLMSLSTIGGFMTAFAAAFCGATYFAPNAATDIDTVARHWIRTIIGSPLQLAAFVEGVRRTNRPLSSLSEIRSAGGALPPALVATIRRSFSASIFNVYGSTEAGGIATMQVGDLYDPASAGYLLAGAEVEIVDEAGAVQKCGTEGIVRVRTGSMADAYFRNPEASAKAFQDGWFYSGDRGVLTEDGLLKLSGRSSEIINRGGVKIDPVAIDHFLQDCPGVVDGAAFGLENAGGLPELAVALVTTDNFDMKALQSALLEKFGKARTPTYYFKIEEIPRNEMGKVLRSRLSQQFAQSVSA